MQKHIQYPVLRAPPAMLLPATLLLLCLSLPAALSSPAPHLLWDLDDWAYDLAHPAPDTSGGLLGLGLLGGQETTAAPPPGLLQGVWGIFFPSADTTTAVPTTKCGGLIGLGIAC